MELQSAPRQTQVAAEQLSKKPHGIKVNPQPQLCTKVQEVLPRKQYFSMEKSFSPAPPRLSVPCPATQTPQSSVS